MHCVPKLYGFQSYSDSSSGFTAHAQEVRRARSTPACVGSLSLGIATQNSHIKVNADVEEYLQVDEKVVQTLSPYSFYYTPLS